MNRRQSLRRSVFRDQGGRCWLCDDQMLLDANPQHPLVCSLDHETPVTNGGTLARRNLRGAHKLCNNMRGHLTPEQARAMIAARKASGRYANRVARILRRLGIQESPREERADWVHTVPFAGAASLGASNA